MGIELLLGGVIKLLGSAGFGSLFGGIMGIFNRKADLAQKRLELEHETRRWEHELQQREADARIMQIEVQGKLQIAQTEAEAAIEVEGYKAMQSSYDYARPTAGSKMEAFASFVRPAVTLAFFGLSAVLTGWVYWQAFSDGFAMPSDRKAELASLVTEWTLSMAGVTIGWWFGTRPGKALRGGK